MVPQMSTKPTRARLIDVAREAGVSRVAAGSVLNGSGGESVRVGEATRKRVLEIARRLNYRPNLAAQQLRGAASRVFGVILDTVNTPVMYNRLAAIEREASRRGYRLMVGQAHNEPSGLAAYLDDFEARGVDGVLCLLDLMRTYRHQLRETLEGHPHLIMHGRPILDGQSCVRVDTEDAIYQVTGHLIDRGRQRVALVIWNEEDALSYARRAGFDAAHRSRGRDSDEPMIFNADSDTPDPSPKIVDTCIDALIGKRSADAVIAPNDVWAVRLMKQMKRRGIRVPDDVAMVGYDNLDIAEVIEPGLTSIDQNHDAYADAALDLLEASGRRSVSEVITIRPQLVVREST